MADWQLFSSQYALIISDSISSENVEMFKFSVTRGIIEAASRNLVFTGGLGKPRKPDNALIKK